MVSESGSTTNPRRKQEFLREKYARARVVVEKIRGIGSSQAGPDIAAAGVGAGLGYGAHRLIQTAGGYGKVAGIAGEAGATLKGTMIDALRRAAAKVAQGEL